MTPSIREFVLAMGGSLPASVVAKATAIAAFGLVGARFARRSRAAVRHVLLAATFAALLLLPVASMVVPGVRIAVPAARMTGAVTPAPAIGGEATLPFTPADTQPAEMPAASPSSRLPLAALLFLGWLAGTTLALIPLIASFWKIRWLRRSGLPWAEGQKVVNRFSLEVGFRRRVEVLLHEELPGPIASGMSHPTVLFPPAAQTWGTEDLDRAAVHELEHVRRGDALTHCLARAVCAVYWFHPLVWMAWRQLILEAERSCDDAVIARWDATAYADQLVALARRLLTAERSPLLAMANRSDLATRVGAVLDTRQRRGRAGPLVVALGCAAALVALTMSPLRTVSAPQSASAHIIPGSSPATGVGAPLPSFEVASIKLNRSDEAQFMIRYGTGRVIVTASSIMQLIRLCYDVKSFQVSGGASWIRSDKYDIEAKESDSTVEELKRLPPDQRSEKIRLMIQSLLADRFQLRVTHGTKELSGFALTVAKGGPKFLQTKFEIPVDKPNADPKGWSCPAGMVCPAWHVPMSGLAKLLSQVRDVGRPVFDQTGLQGTYNIEFRWAPMENQNKLADTPEGVNSRAVVGKESGGPSIFTALQEQLGLKLEPTKGPVEILVIDHIERPSEN